MKILMLHNAYQQPGGEDAAVANEAALLKKSGVKVSLQLVDNAQILGLAEKARTTMHVAYDARRRGWLRGLVTETKPDLIHVHNFFPLLTTAIHEEAHLLGIPIVQTLHNFRLFCAAATFERNGDVCELCLHHSRLNAIRYRCYRSSLIGSAALVRMQMRAVQGGLLPKTVSRFIALTEFARAKFIEGGLPAEKLVVKPNFLDRPHPPRKKARTGALFVGRLSQEKGIHHLVRAWRRLPDIRLNVVGDGPLRASLENRAPSNVHFLGRLSSPDVEDQMRGAAVLIMPSTCYEGFPITIAEAFANGLPIVASGIGSLAELVEPGITGAHCMPGNDDSIVEVVRSIFASPDALREMSANTRRLFELRYTAERNFEILKSIYQEALMAR